MIAEVNLGRRSTQRSRGCGHSTLELIVIIAIEHIMLSIVLVLEHHLYFAESLCELGPSWRAIRLLTVGKTAPV